MCLDLADSSAKAIEWSQEATACSMLHICRNCHLPSDYKAPACMTCLAVLVLRSGPLSWSQRGDWGLGSLRTAGLSPQS